MHWIRVLQRVAGQRAPILLGVYVAEKLPLKTPLMAAWAWWDFVLLAIVGLLILWGLAPELKKIAPINIVIVDRDGVQQKMVRGAFVLVFALLLVEYLDLLGEHIVATREFERLYEAWKVKGPS